MYGPGCSGGTVSPIQSAFALLVVTTRMAAIITIAT
jgi:hypothetical protein